MEGAELSAVLDPVPVLVEVAVERLGGARVPVVPETTPVPVVTPLPVPDPVAPVFPVPLVVRAKPVVKGLPEVIEEVVMDPVVPKVDMQSSKLGHQTSFSLPAHLPIPFKAPSSQTSGFVIFPSPHREATRSRFEKSPSLVSIAK